MTRERPLDLLIAHTRVEAALRELREAASDLSIRAQTDGEPFEFVSAAVTAAVQAENLLAGRYVAEARGQ